MPDNPAAFLPAFGAQEVTRIPIVDAAPGTPGLGAGIRFGTNPYRSDRGSLDLVPLYLYEGDYFFAHGTSMGVHAYRNRFFSLDVVARYRFLKLDPDDRDFSDPIFEGLDKRDQTVDAGIDLGFQGNWGEVRLSAVTDLLDRHNGSQFDVSYRHRFDRGRWTLSPFVIVSFQNQSLTDYYFGVSEAEARRSRPAYSPNGAWNLGLGLNTSYRVTDEWRWFANIEFEKFDDEISNSPLVEDRNFTTAYIGGSYFFGNVTSVTGESRRREREWSWRVNYGYQADGNIVGDIDQGDLSKSVEADTNIAGFTLSKLLVDGSRVDFLGRTALYRHFENGAQDDFFNVVAYIMAMGKGYFARSLEPSFRFGFGFGFSYAQEVPIIEQIKQGEDSETNRFQNYLEMLVDFPLDRIFTKSKSVKGCYTGITVVHRSGIFATSDILGNVSGGSDWITAHVECVR